jgi:hypothetical protein
MHIKIVLSKFGFPSSTGCTILSNSSGRVRVWQIGVHVASVAKQMENSAKYKRIMRRKDGILSQVLKCPRLISPQLLLDSWPSISPLLLAFHVG